MAKEKANFFDQFLTLILGIILLISGISMPLNEKYHRKISGVISSVETRYGKRKTRPSKIFWLERKHIYYKDRAFSNSDIHSSFGSRRQLNDYFKKGKKVSFHVDKSELDENVVDIYSLEVDGTVIVPLKSKWKLKLQIILFGDVLALRILFICYGRLSIDNFKISHPEFQEKRSVSSDSVCRNWINAMILSHVVAAPFIGV